MFSNHAHKPRPTKLIGVQLELTLLAKNCHCQHSTAWKPTYKHAEFFEGEIWMGGGGGVYKMTDKRPTQIQTDIVASGQVSKWSVLPSV